MSRTTRDVKYRYKKLRNRVINGNDTYPFVYRSFRCLRFGELIKGDETDWNDFYRSRYIHGYDGGCSSSVSDFTTASPRGYTSWKEREGMKAKRWCKRAASRGRRRYGKFLIEEYFSEDDGFDKVIPARSAYPRKTLSWKEKRESRTPRYYWNRHATPSYLSGEEIEERKLLREKWERR